MGNKTITFDSSAPEKKAYEYTYQDVSLLANVVAENTFEEHLTIANKRDIEAVKGAVKNIFTWIPGERILEPEFGNTVRRLLYEGITEYNSEQIVNECKMLMTRWEPRAVIDKIFKKDSVEETENNQVSIVMIWHVIGLPDQQYQTEVISNGK